MAKKPLKPADFKPGWRRVINADDQKPVTLSRAPWDHEDSDDDRKSA